MLSASPNYSYAQSFLPTVQNITPGAGFAGLGTSFLNAYSQAHAQNQKGQPVQLNSAAPSPFSQMISALMNGGGGAPAAPSTPDPSTAGVY